MKGTAQVLHADVEEKSSQAPLGNKLSDIG